MRKPIVFRGSARKKTEKASGLCDEELCHENGVDCAGEAETAARTSADVQPDGACREKESDAAAGEPVVELSELTDVKESLEELCDKLL